jgi:hypothetical protein
MIVDKLVTQWPGLEFEQRRRDLIISRLEGAISSIGSLFEEDSHDLSEGVVQSEPVFKPTFNEFEVVCTFDATPDSQTGVWRVSINQNAMSVRKQRIAAAVQSSENCLPRDINRRIS